MKILFIIEGLNESTKIAQPWKHVVEIASRMSKLGYDVEVISEKIEGNEDIDEIFGVPILRIKRNQLLFDIPELLYMINEINPDIINWHCSDTWSSIYFSRLKGKMKRGIIWTIHSNGLSLQDLKNLNLLELLQLYKFWNNVLNSFAEKIFVKDWIKTPLLRHTITLSNRAANNLVKLGLNKSSITTIYSGVDIDTFHPSTKKSDDPIILYYGPPSTFRGVDILYSAFKIIKKNVPKSKLLFLSRDSNEKNTWNNRFSNLENTEIVYGFLSQTDLINYLQQASVIVLPFKFWPQVACPLTILESMALGKPVITTFAGSNEEIIRNGETGVLVPAGDVKKLADETIRLLNDASARDMLGKNAQVQVKLFHDWNVIVNKTLEIYLKNK